MAEAAAGRWNRDVAQQQADRKTRGWDNKTEGRKEREYVDYDSRDPQGDTGTVGPAN